MMALARCWGTLKDARAEAAQAQVVAPELLSRGVQVICEHVFPRFYEHDEPPEGHNLIRGPIAPCEDRRPAIPKEGKMP